MSELILHHYPNSPFAEKIRTLLGYKGLAWRSVHQPVIMPKPDLVALTGGYRRVPVLQIGADVYCDTALIARVIERLFPSPPVFTDAGALSDLGLAYFADQLLFAAAVAYALQPAGARDLLAGMTPVQIAAFAEDRRKMGRSRGYLGMPLAEASGTLHTLLPRLDAQLADGRRFLAGDAARICDFSVYHPLWFMGRAKALASIFDPYPHLRGWLGRMAAIGHGTAEPMAPEAAIEAARAAEPAMLPGRSQRDIDGCGAGDAVTVNATDYALEPIAGVLANAEPDSFAIRRLDERAGEVVVHFPRIGFRLARAEG